MYPRRIGILMVAGVLLAACASTLQSTNRSNNKEDSATIERMGQNPETSENPIISETEGASLGESSIEFLPEEDPPKFAEQEFNTDFSRHVIPYEEVESGGPPKDGIPAIDDPIFIAVEEADAWLEAEEPVLVVTANGDAKAYPIQIMTWHEIVNDQVGDRPLTITFCPLCNTGIAFEREFDQYVLDFGTTGRLRYSNLIMYDRQTETWWQQASGKGLAGEFAGRQLSFYPVTMVSWKDFKTAYPEGLILSRDTGYNRPYGNNPYPGYDNISSKPGLFRGPETPDKLPALARVLTIELENEAVAYPFNVLQDEQVINDSFAGEDIVIFWESGTSSALDAPTVAGGKDVGAANAFKREIDGRTLSFVWDGNAIIDEQTGSDWNLFGIAEEGPLSGTHLEPLIAINHFWFSWAAYKPDTRIYQP